LFERTVALPQPIDPALSHSTWESDGKVHISMRKANAPSYWPSLVKLGEAATADSTYSG